MYLIFVSSKYISVHFYHNKEPSKPNYKTFSHIMYNIYTCVFNNFGRINIVLGKNTILLNMLYCIYLLLFHFIGKKNFAQTICVKEFAQCNGDR